MGPLDGVTVVSLEQAIAAPFATRQLADWGARVIKIERPGGGDFARYYDEAVRGLSSHFVWTNRGKESMTLNLKHAAGQAVLTRLMQRADVLVQNLRPGALDALGFDRDTLRTRFPRLIACNISGYGPDGPYRDRKAYDLLIQAESGLLSITGSEETPVKVGISIADIAAGMYALSGILMALIHRQTTGQGTVIDISMLETLAEWMGYPLNYAHFSGTAPARTGAHHATIAPYGPYRLKDGEDLFLAIQNEREWQAFCEVVLGDPSLARDQRFRQNSARVAHRAELNDFINQAFSDRDPQDVVARLTKAHVAFAHLNSLDQLWHHPQLRARSRFEDIETTQGPVEALLPPVNFVDVTPAMGRVPEMGEQTQSILNELGYTVQEVSQLKDQGAI